MIDRPSINVVFFTKFLIINLAVQVALARLKKSMMPLQMMTMKNLRFLAHIVVVFGRMIMVSCLIFLVVFPLIIT